MNPSRQQKARERSHKWREARQAAAAPEAREIDRALVAALIHVVLANKGRGTIAPDVLPTIIEVAGFILHEGYDRQDAKTAVEDRVRKLGGSREVRRAQERASLRTQE